MLRLCFLFSSGEGERASSQEASSPGDVVIAEKGGKTWHDYSHFLDEDSEAQKDY